MKGMRGAAVELLMSHPDSTVAEMLGVRLSTLRRWMRDSHFAELLRARESEQKGSVARIARQAAVNAASSLCQITSDISKPDAKVLLEVLKVSGAFAAEEVDAAQAIAEIIARAAEQEGRNG